MSASDDALDYTTISFKFYLINLIISKQIITNNSSEAIAENFEVRGEHTLKIMYNFSTGIGQSQLLTNHTVLWIDFHPYYQDC